MRQVGLAALGVMLLAAGSALASETATATIQQTGTSGSNFDYTITVKDTGSTAIGTFWYSWIPGENFMKSSPVSVTDPSNWTDNITFGDGYAIQWLADSGAEIQPGGSLTFSYESPDNFATTTGNSPYYSNPSVPTGTSFIYSGGPFSDGGFQFVVAAPEPGSFALLTAASLIIMNWRRRDGEKTRMGWIRLPECGD